MWWSRVLHEERRHCLRRIPKLEVRGTSGQMVGGLWHNIHMIVKLPFGSESEEQGTDCIVASTDEADGEMDPTVRDQACQKFYLIR